MEHLDRGWWYTILQRSLPSSLMEDRGSDPQDHAHDGQEPLDLPDEAIELLEPLGCGTPLAFAEREERPSPQAPVGVPMMTETSTPQGRPLPPFRVLVPLPARPTIPPATCPFCDAPSLGTSGPRSYACGASWSGPAGTTPCGRPTSTAILGRLRAWCRDQGLYGAAALLRRCVPQSFHASWPGPPVPAWLLSTRAWTAPPQRCPSCESPVASSDAGCCYYGCGTLLLAERPGLVGVSAHWRAYLPCQRPPLRLLLDAMDTLPDCPLDQMDRARLLRLVFEGCWI